MHLLCDDLSLRVPWPDVWMGHGLMYRTDVWMGHAAGYRLRQAELLFQNARIGDADSMMRGVVRKNPNYAGAPPEPGRHS